MEKPNLTEVAKGGTYFSPAHDRNVKVTHVYKDRTVEIEYLIKDTVEETDLSLGRGMENSAKHGTKVYRIKKNEDGTVDIEIPIRDRVASTSLQRKKSS